MLAVKEISKASSCYQHDAHQNRIAIGELQFRHVLEVHPVDSGQKRQGDKDGRKQGQNPHDFGHAQVDRIDVGFLHTVDKFPATFG